MKKKSKRALKLELLDHSRPRPVIWQRSAVFEDKKKYKRSRSRAAERREIEES
jgi:hypothetical protein